MKTFKLPDLGEGLPEAEILKWLVKEGDTVTVDQPMVEVENAKAVMEIPVPYSGKILKLYGGEGDIIETDEPLVDIEPDEVSAELEKPKTTQADTGTVVGEVRVGNEVKNERASTVGGGSTDGIKATPAIRALARKLNVDLKVVTPSGTNGVITAGDVERVSKIMAEVGPLEGLRGPRRVMARYMSMAHAEVVPATIVDDADVNAWPQGTDVMIRVIRALVAGCTAEPALNAWYDSHSVGRRVLKKIELGVAVDSEGGLFVPVLNDVANRSAKDLRAAINKMKEEIANRTAPAEELRGATITLSNVGSIAGKYSSPVVLPPTVAIMATGKIRETVAVVNGSFEARKIMPLSLTFDHRAVTGGEAARFLGAVMEDLSKPE